MVTLAVDAMGGDHGPLVTVPAILNALKANQDLRVLLFGRESLIQSFLPSDLPQSLSERLQITHCDSVVGNDESPAKVLRHKRQSSLARMLTAVASNQAQGCISAGNTGALMALGKHIVGMSETMDRPAIVSTLPRADGGHTYMLDLGANIGCDSELLYQFALMGSAVARCLNGGDSPRVALLNIGSEASKGNDQVKAANELLLSDSGMDYIGYIEGSDLFEGKADVVVCDGFVGNVALKTMEGLARFIIGQVQLELTRSWWQKLFAPLLGLAWQPVEKAINPAAYSGAVLVGLQGLVVKSHGGSTPEEFSRAIELASHYAEKDFVARVDELLKAD